MPDYRAMTRDAAVRAGIDPDLFERQIDQESGYALDVIECRRASGAGAQGIAQIVPRFHPSVDPCDPPAALAYAAGLMRNNLAVRNGDWALALSMYNAGPGATASGLAGTLDGWPYAETVRYVSSILQISDAEARRRLTGQSTGGAVKLSDVLARGRSRLGDPYIWDGEVPGSFDCSGFIKWCYQGQLPSFTDAIFDETTRVETPAPGDIVLYEYADASQPGVRFPHVGLYLDDGHVLDARYPMGVGEHEQLARSKARRYYRRAANVTVDTLDQPSPVPTPPPTPEPAPAPTPTPAPAPAPSEDIGHLRDVIGYASHDVADALAKEAATLRARMDDMRASLEALEAAINTLRNVA
jgi:cell wall-associated NlpC family hydrolase